MKLFLLSYEYVNDSLAIKHYKLIYAETLDEAETKLDDCIFGDYHNVINQTIN